MLRSLLLLREGVLDGLHPVHGADEDDGGAATNHEAEGPGVVRQLVRVVGVPA